MTSRILNRLSTGATVLCIGAFAVCLGTVLSAFNPAEPHRKANPPILEISAAAPLPTTRTATPAEKAATIREIAAGDAYYWRMMSDASKSQAAEDLVKAKADLALARINMALAQAQAK